MVGLAHRAGIEVTNSSNGFIARNMGVAMENKSYPQRCLSGGFVDEVKEMAASLQGEGFRCETPWVTVALDGLNRRSEALDFSEQLPPTNIAKVPDFLGLDEGGSGRGR